MFPTVKTVFLRSRPKFITKCTKSNLSFKPEDFSSKVLTAFGHSVRVSNLAILESAVFLDVGTCADDTTLNVATTENVIMS